MDKTIEKHDNKDNSINETLKQKIFDWLDQKLPEDKRDCNVCGSKEWGIEEEMVAPLVFKSDTKGILYGGIIYPMIMATCINCANTKFFNAKLMGLIKETPEKPIEEYKAEEKTNTDNSFEESIERRNIVYKIAGYIGLITFFVSFVIIFILFRLFRM